MNNVLESISNKAGHNGAVEGAYVQSDEFDLMNTYAVEQMKQNDNSGRENYDILSKNCSTFAEDVLKQDKTVDKQAPKFLINIPNLVIKRWQKSFFPVSYKK